MSQTLGEKLRQAREEKGLSLADVAEQTRISSLYLEAIENDDYKILPGGIFNKGFIKSYAKFVGINEQEALMDYQANLARTEGTASNEDPKVYRPEVLTDDRSGSMLPTILVAAVVLALMTAGILYLVSYLRGSDSGTTSSASKPAVNASSEPANTNASSEPSTSSGVPDMASLVVEVKAGTQPVKIVATVDADAAKPVNIAASGSTTFNPKQSLTLNYLRWNSSVLSMTINGKEIKLPAEPLDAKDKDRIIFTISAETLPAIWNSGSVGSVPAVAAEPSPSPETTAQKPSATPVPKPTANPSANTAKPPANTAAKPPANTAKPPTMMTTTKPTPKPGE